MLLVMDCFCTHCLKLYVCMNSESEFCKHHVSHPAEKKRFHVQSSIKLFAVGGPDVILKGADLYLLHFSIEQPAASTLYLTSLDLVESNFVLPTGYPATREQIMQALQRLQELHIRATYWEDSITIRQVVFLFTSLT
ncbi:hypothetical protein PR048_033712 [Dryococelus australis]|uniref:Laminin IV type A domain-containing protein n=1 Tax=Dryococelus australis TaxID=614101 RepID=A0ABQ9G4B2_9NEOP|nr:hypothetical protein PR048_033712 [Dryococelus australis]